MIFPAISNYLESLTNPEGLFAGGVLPEIVLDEFGAPVLSSGNYGVVFKVKSNGEYGALKCFTRYQSGRIESYRAVSRFLSSVESSYILRYAFYDDEIYVFSDNSDEGAYYPMVLMEWIDGKSLTQCISECISLRDTEALKELVVRFETLALWLLNQEFAHGDIKPDNIMVDGMGNLRLIDYDGIFLPEMKGQMPRELGTHGFQHPRRDERFFDKHIDDYSIAVIAASLRTLCYDMSLYADYYNGDNIIFDIDSLFEGRCEAYQKALQISLDNSDVTLAELLSFLVSPSPRLDDLPRELSGGNTYVMDDYCFVGENSSGLSMVCLQGQYGFVDARKRLVIPAMWDNAFDVSEGRIAVRRRNKWGFVDLHGNIVVDCVYGEADSFSEGFAVVCRRGKYGYIDRSGNVVIPLEFDDAWRFGSGLAVVRLGDKCGYIDSAGKMVIDAVYDRAYGFSEGFACVCRDGRFGYINLKGEVVIELKYDYAAKVRNGMAYLEAGNKQFYITLLGK